MSKQKLDELLTDMRMNVAWTDEATMPIPLYERMKAAIKASTTREAELQADVERLEEALEVYASERMWIECEGGKRTTVSWKNSSGGDSSFGKLTHLWRGHVGELHPNEVAKQALNHKD